MSNEFKYETAVKRLDEIVKILESGDVSLDEALNLFEEGTRLTSQCTKKLEQAKQKIIEIEKD